MFYILSPIPLLPSVNATLQPKGWTPTVFSQLCLPLSSRLVLTMGHYNIVCNWLDTGSPLLNTHMHCCSNTWCWFCKKRGGLLLVRAVSGPLHAPLCPLGAPVSKRGVSQQSGSSYSLLPVHTQRCFCLLQYFFCQITNFSPGKKKKCFRTSRFGWTRTVFLGDGGKQANQLKSCDFQSNAAVSVFH